MLKRIRRPAVLTAGILGLLTAVSLAFFIGSFMADGSHTGTTGSGGTGTKTLPMNVDFPDGQLTPTQTVPLTATLSNTSSETVKFMHLTPTITTGVAGCKPEWFRLRSTSPFWNEAFTGKAKEMEYAPGTHSLADMVGVEELPTFTVEMTETEVDQSPCEAAAITVSLRLTQ